MKRTCIHIHDLDVNLEVSINITRYIITTDYMNTHQSPNQITDTHLKCKTPAEGLGCSWVNVQQLRNNTSPWSVRDVLSAWRRRFCMFASFVVVVSSCDTVS